MQARTPGFSESSKLVHDGFGQAGSGGKRLRLRKGGAVRVLLGESN